MLACGERLEEPILLATRAVALRGARQRIRPSAMRRGGWSRSATIRIVRIGSRGGAVTVPPRKRRLPSRTSSAGSSVASSTSRLIGVSTRPRPRAVRVRRGRRAARGDGVRRLLVYAVPEHRLDAGLPFGSRVRPSQTPRMQREPVDEGEELTRAVRGAPSTPASGARSTTFRASSSPA